MVAKTTLPIQTAIGMPGTAPVLARTSHHRRADRDGGEMCGLEEREIETMVEAVVHATRALLHGRVDEGAFGPDVMFAVRGFRAGLVDRKRLMETVAHAYRTLGRNAVQFDDKGNIRKR